MMRDDTAELVDRQKHLVQQMRSVYQQFPPGTRADLTHNWLTDVNITAPANAGGEIIPWRKLKFNPVGLHHLRRWLGACPMYPGFFNMNQPRFRAADIAWFAAGAHNDGNHIHSPTHFHPIQKAFMQDTNGSKDERKTMFNDMETLVWDLLTMLDRLSGSTSLLMRCPGTVIPGAPPAPEYIKNHLYFPPAFLAHNPNIQSWLRTVCQEYVEQIGVPTVRKWYERCRTEFGWSLKQDGHPAPNPILPTATTFPAAQPRSSHFVYPGQPEQVIPTQAAPSFSQASADSYIPNEDRITMDAHDHEVILLQESLAFARLELQELRARLTVFESGANMLAQTIATAPATPNRKSQSTSHGRTPISSQRAFPKAPVSPFGHAVAVPNISPHVTIRHSRQNTPTPSKTRFATPSHFDQDGSDGFEPGSSRGRGRAPEELNGAFVTRALEACHLEHMAETIGLVLRFLPTNIGEADLVSHLVLDARIPAEFAQRIAAAAFLDRVHANIDE